jgi:hypothetical protein
VPTKPPELDVNTTLAFILGERFGSVVMTPRPENDYVDVALYDALDGGTSYLRWDCNKDCDAAFEQLIADLKIPSDRVGVPKEIKSETEPRGDSLMFLVRVAAWRRRGSGYSIDCGWANFALAPMPATISSILKVIDDDVPVYPYVH